MLWTGSRPDTHCGWTATRQGWGAGSWQLSSPRSHEGFESQGPTLPLPACKSFWLERELPYAKLFGLEGNCKHRMELKYLLNTMIYSR